MRLHVSAGAKMRYILYLVRLSGAARPSAAHGSKGGAMSPVFRHGRLRLYLLKLLDEAPRHGYEIIRLLQDRFLGVYAPSPGTIYPRLARLEEEGLVTHDEVGGKKVYRITEKGRGELRARLDDLADLEEAITASVRDIAREVSGDVRETVRALREEIFSAVQDIHDGTRPGVWQQRERARAQARKETGGADPRTYRDLERLARKFRQDLRAAAWQAQAVSEDAVRMLRDILDETITRIRAEVFCPPARPYRPARPSAQAASATGPSPGAKPAPGPQPGR
jgi:DNA-binding PadR family transcriptional regulator